MERMERIKTGGKGKRKKQGMLFLFSNFPFYIFIS